MSKVVLLILHSFLVGIPRIAKFMGGNTSRNIIGTNIVWSGKEVMLFSFPYMKGKSKICSILSLSV